MKANSDLDDAAREAAIDETMQRFQAATGRRERERLQQELFRLIRGRSPAQVARMERAKGLR